jgi:hypothetical protein
MMELRLQHQLDALEAMLRRVRLWRQLTFCWASTGGAELLLFLTHKFTGWNTRPLWWLVVVGGSGVAYFLWWRAHRQPADFRAVIIAIEKKNPEVRHLIATAAEQEPDLHSGKFGFLQLRVIEQVVKHPHRILWEQDFRRKLKSAKNAQMAALAGLLMVLCLGTGSTRRNETLGTWFAPEIAVAPGDIEVERGTGLVISARFGGTPPPEAMLVLISASGKTKRLPLERHLADPVFGTSLLEVSEDGFYHVEYRNKKTRDYKISVFDYPVLTCADADLRFPNYTGLTNQTIRDTHRISAVEGTRLTYALELNKPVTRARFIGKEQMLALGVQTNAVAVLNDFTLTNSARYWLELVDSAGRTNKTPVEFVIQVLPDLPPEVKITFPRGDPRVSSLEELQLQGEARDDFGLLKYGFGLGVAGQEPQFFEMGQSAPANVKRQFTNQIALEKLGVKIDQVVSYFAWADDYGPDGQVRRTFSDIFFAEVRPFEEIFRADESGASESQQGNQDVRLAELQKQIVIATWNIQREKTAQPAHRIHED